MVMACHRLPHKADASVCIGQPYGPRLLGPPGAVETLWHYTDKWGAYRRYLPPEQHVIWKLLMQKIERKHVMLRTRLKRLNRQRLRFSRSIAIHNAVMGLFINRYEFGSVS